LGEDVVNGFVDTLFLWFIAFISSLLLSGKIPPS
jgi:hypothetical protein